MHKCHQRHALLCVVKSAMNEIKETIVPPEDKSELAREIRRTCHVPISMLFHRTLPWVISDHQFRVLWLVMLLSSLQPPSSTAPVDPHVEARHVDARS